MIILEEKCRYRELPIFVRAQLHVTQQFIKMRAIKLHLSNCSDGKNDNNVKLLTCHYSVFIVCLLQQIATIENGKINFCDIRTMDGDYW